MMKVKYSKKGLANFYGDYILINEKLKEDKTLRDYIVKHELGHSKKFDLMHEFKSIKLSIMPRLIWFFIKTPSCWVDIFPIQKNENGWVYDINLLILYSLEFVFLFIMFLLASRFFY